MIVENTAGMLEYLRRINISPIEYKIIGKEIHINLNHQQIYYRMNSGIESGYITMRNSQEYLILWNKIFKHE